jgi:large subunit ribosomal protein L15
VNLKSLEKFPAGTTIDVPALKSCGLVRGKKKVKVLADGKLSKILTVKAHAFSEKAREMITALGGNVEVV